MLYNPFPGIQKLIDHYKARFGHPDQLAKIYSSDTYFSPQLGYSVRLDKNEDLVVAASDGYFDAVKFLLDNGADIHYNDDQALRRASVCGQTSIVELLLDRGANMNARKDREYGCAMYNAIHANRLEVVELLLNKGADIHYNNDEFLRNALYSEYFPIVQLLLDRGANMNALSSHVSDYAIANNRLEMFEFLAKMGLTSSVKKT